MFFVVFLITQNFRGPSAPVRWASKDVVWWGGVLSEAYDVLPRKIVGCSSKTRLTSQKHVFFCRKRGLFWRKNVKRPPPPRSPLGPNKRPSRDIKKIKRNMFQTGCFKHLVLKHLVLAKVPQTRALKRLFRAEHDVYRHRLRIYEITNHRNLLVFRWEKDELLFSPPDPSIMEKHVFQKKTWFKTFDLKH